MLVTVRQVDRSRFIPLDGTGLEAGDAVDLTVYPGCMVVLTPVNKRGAPRRQRRRSAGK
jgi:hypothetical protein